VPVIDAWTGACNRCLDWCLFLLWLPIQYSQLCLKYWIEAVLFSKPQ